MISAFEDEGDEYWATRVIQSQLGNGATALELAKSHPKQFIWACGRSGDASLIEEIRKAFASANDKLPLLGITTWAYGKLGSLDDLKRMDKLLADMEREFNC